MAVRRIPANAAQVTRSRINGDTWTRLVDEPLTSTTGLTGVAGTWTIVNGYLTNTSQAFESYSLKYDTSIGTQTYYAISVDVRFDESNPVQTYQRGGIICSWNGSTITGMPVAFIQRTPTAYVEVDEWGSAVRSTNSITQPGFGEWHRLGVIVKNLSIQSFFDNTAGANLATAAAGKKLSATYPFIGLASSGAQVAFRNLRMWTIAADPGTSRPAGF